MGSTDIFDLRFVDRLSRVVQSRLEFVNANGELPIVEVVREGVEQEQFTELGVNALIEFSVNSIRVKKL